MLEFRYSLPFLLLFFCFFFFGFACLFLFFFFIMSSRIVRFEQREEMEAPALATADFLGDGGVCAEERANRNQV